ncbi:hypothetical protein SAMN06265795_101143 [Noviherbaspirillum humi]|uniref:Uncharacterized protein n=1 Tax=Noviherbaspirillum humi TaxID=1688639 RepID=A0A239BXG9_9BURK|nr:glycine zipper domain-containing protein [Noviherbaspirillum humi]SNS12590.1 hypothetical protein SAMN06265795_101143 [Noviherbaspirillum humi]
MSKIIAGHVQLQSDVDIAVEELCRAGFSREQISSFYMGPAGRHAQYPIGGDADKSQGAKESDKGVAMGAAAGAAIGVATTPFLGPVGAITGGLVGAHVGGLVGGMSSMKEHGDPGDENDVENTLPQRMEGMMVAVAVPDDGMLDSAVNVLRSIGATNIECAEGTIVDGDWRDFDPVSPVHLVPTGHERRL